MGRLEGKVAVVTGGTSGIGKAIATGLAREGATVVLLARSRERGEAAAGEIRSKVAGANVELVEGDLASLESVRGAVAQLVARHPAVNVLVCSAGVFHRSRGETVDGFERTFQVNYLAQFLLTVLLEDAMRKGAPSKVVFVASKYGNAKIPFDDLNVTRRKFSAMNSVPQTKLAEVLLAQELAERWGPYRISVNAIHPGLVAHTGLLTEVGGVWRFVTNLLGSTPEKGADTALWLATDPPAAEVSGKFLAKRRPIRAPGDGSDEAVRKRLFTESLNLVKMPEAPR